MTPRLSPQRMAFAGVGLLALVGHRWRVPGATRLGRRSGATRERQPLRESATGRQQLCELRLDEVALATTHNAMNDAEDGFLYPSQERGIEAQLEAGVRGFLVDAFLGSPRMAGDEQIVYTELTDSRLAQDW